MNKATEQLSFTVPLSFAAHSIAQKYSKQQSNPRKAKQVYLNTLAVYAVDFYLRCMGFKTDWDASDSRNPLMLKFMDVADLDVKQLGKLECRPVLPDADVCHIPPDAWEDRIGYLAVQLNQSLKQATLLGFTQTAAREVSLNQLQSPEDFLKYLSQIKHPEPVNLRNWIEGIIEAGWLTLEELLSLEQDKLVLMYRDPMNITRGQQIDLGIEVAQQPLALVVTLPPNTGSELDIQVRVYPLRGQTYLPQGIKLMVMDESEEVVLNTEAREADNFIQLGFSAELGEQFSVTVALGEASIRQEFVI
ncbi:MAG: hypothetical protein Fur006_05240 [Coleofasciculaceae cyanobacterium]